MADPVITSHPKFTDPGNADPAITFHPSGGVGGGEPGPPGPPGTPGVPGTPGSGGILVQVPTGAINGANALFTVAPYTPGTTLVYLNGLVQTPGADYSESNPLLGQIQLADPPLAGDRLRVAFGAVSV